MIFEPQFPSSFLELLTLIVSSQLECDLSKSQIGSQVAKTLFDSIDLTSTGYIYLEDLYIWLKKRGVSLTKKQLKFINRYFGFSRKEKLSIEDFRKYFLSFRNPNNKEVEKIPPETGLKKLIECVIHRYTQIQERRWQASKDIDILKRCLSTFYSDEVGVVNPEILRQALQVTHLCSRLSLTLLTQYIIGQENKQISLKQLFLFQGSISPQSKELKKQAVASVKQNAKKLSLNNLQQSKPSSSFKTKQSDILLQIENIQNSIKQKKELYSQRKKCVEEAVRSKAVGTLIKRPSSSDLLKSIQQKMEEDQEITAKTTSYPKKQDRNIEDIIQNGRSSGFKYNWKDEVDEEETDYLQSSNSRSVPFNEGEEVISRASSCAKLKIQEIERRVMGRIGQRTSKASEIPSSFLCSRKSSSQLRSRFSSLTKS